MRALPAVYGQRDPRWGLVRLGDATADRGSTIRDYGCYVTCFAMLAGYYGSAMTPDEVNARLEAEGQFLSGNLVADDALEGVAPALEYVGTFEYRTGPADLERLRELLEDPGVSVILEVDFNHNSADGTQSHFVVAVGCDGERVTIADPWTGRVEDLGVAYGSRAWEVIQKFVVYRGSVAAPDGRLPAVDGAGEVELTERERGALELIRALYWDRGSIESAISKLGRAAEIGRTLQVTRRMPKGVKGLVGELVALGN